MRKPEPVFAGIPTRFLLSSLLNTGVILPLLYPHMNRCLTLKVVICEKVQQQSLSHQKSFHIHTCIRSQRLNLDTRIRTFLQYLAATWLLVFLSQYTIDGKAVK